MIRLSRDADFQTIWTIINDAAQVYKGVIPDECWHEPYMGEDELRREIVSGVEFWLLEDDGEVLGVMGIQDKGVLTLIRHAYVRTRNRRSGVGTRLLRFLETRTTKPILVGTWTNAIWAVSFYQRSGYRLLSTEEKSRLLRKFWTISEMHADASVVLGDERWWRSKEGDGSQG